MATRVFISYRREDSASSAGRLHDRLEHELGRDLLFMDVDAIPLGLNFVEVLRNEVAKCDVLLAVIGLNWLDARDEHGNRRLDDPNDFLRVEIATALQRNIPVIPVLVDGARIPKADRLPEDLKELEQRNALDVRHVSFRSDVDKLIQGLKGLSDQAEKAKETEAASRRPSDEATAHISSKEKVDTSPGRTVAETTERARSAAGFTSSNWAYWVVPAVAVIALLLYLFATPSQQVTQRARELPPQASNVLEQDTDVVQPTIDGQYMGTPIPTNDGVDPNGRPCRPRRFYPVTLEIANNHAKLVFNPDTHLIFSGPVTEGRVQLPGRNDSGPGAYLTGVIANGQFDGSTSGLACNASMHLTRR